MKKIWMFLLVILFGVAGCRTEEEIQTGSCLYYLNENETEVVREAYTPKADFKEALVHEYVEALNKEPEHRGYKKLLPEEVKLLDYSYGEEKQLILNFDANYYTLTGIREILCRAALVETFCQIDGIEYVEFYVNGMPYMNGEVPVGMMKSDDFIDRNMNSQTAIVTIYFTGEDGLGLFAAQRQVRYSPAVSMEQLVVQQLIEGPSDEEKNEGLYPVIPQGTQLLKINTKDGVCYLDLNEKFLNRMEGATEEVVIYSIVNSLVELPNINKVQFRINGEERKNYQSIAFSDMFERNLDLIEGDN